MNRRACLTTLTAIALAGLGNAAASAPRRSVITNFDDEDRKLKWQVVNDTVMGGVSSSRLEVQNGKARFSGRLSLENNGGFASFRSSGAMPDLSGTDAVVLRTKGDGRKYQFRIRTETGWRAPSYSADFQTQAGKWQEHRLPFADFVPGWRGRTLRGLPSIDPAKIQSLGILLGDKKPGNFELEIDWIRATG